VTETSPAQRVDVLHNAVFSIIVIFHEMGSRATIDRLNHGMHNTACPRAWYMQISVP